jgi:hypothetical protein
MKGFEFGTEEDIERRLIEVLESDAYFCSVQHWERKRAMCPYDSQFNISVAVNYFDLSLLFTIISPIIC